MEEFYEGKNGDFQQYFLHEISRISELKRETVVKISFKDNDIKRLQELTIWK